MSRSTTRGRSALAAGALALALLAGCSSSSGESDNAADVADSAWDGSAGADSAEDAADGNDAAGLGGAEGGSAEQSGSAQEETVEQSLPDGRMIARDAEVGVAVEDIEPAAATVRATAVAAAGWVVSEEVHPDGSTDTYDGHAVLVVSVPSESMDATLTDLAPIGRVMHSTITSLDVTADYTDTTARIETLEASIDRLRGLMEEASGIEDIVALERELAQREADLDALRAHAEGLETDVARSTITVSLYEVDPEESLAEVQEDPPTGFAAGLEGGWNAFLGAIAFLLTAIGALLPFTVVAAVVLGAVLWWRARRARAGGDSTRGSGAAGDNTRGAGSVAGRTTAAESSTPE